MRSLAVVQRPPAAASAPSFSRKLVAAILCLAAPALAGPPGLEIDWQAPAGCPDQAAIRRYVAQVIANTEDAASAMRARAVVSRISVDRWAADLTVRSSAGEESARSLEGPTCDAVSEAAALVIALAIHSSASAQSPVPPAAHPERETEAGPSSASQVDRDRRPLVAAGLAGDVGSLPGPAYGARLAVGWTLAGIRWEPFAAYFARKRATVEGRDTVGADFALAAAGLRGCYSLSGRVVGLAPCLGAGLDWIGGAGFGSREPRQAANFSATVAGAWVASFHLTDMVSPRLEIEAVAALRRAQFVVSGAGTVYTEAPVALRGAVGMELHF